MEEIANKKELYKEDEEFKRKQPKQKAKEKRNNTNEQGTKP